jgi:hypothetical protein
MDALDMVLAPGRDLLGRVDAALAAAGAPSGALIWPLLRRVGALPGDALEFAAGLDPAPLRSAAEELWARSAEFLDERRAVDRAVAERPWEGSGADAFGSVWRALAQHIGDAPAADQASLAGRLAALATYVDNVASWSVTLRERLAMAVADALTSNEAVVLRSAPPDSTTASGAAAAVGATVLEPVAEAMRDGADLHDEWSSRLAELFYRGPVETGPVGSVTTTRVDL